MAHGCGVRPISRVGWAFAHAGLVTPDLAAWAEARPTVLHLGPSCDRVNRGPRQLVGGALVGNG